MCITVYSHWPLDITSPRFRVALHLMEFTIRYGAVFHDSYRDFS